jgi:hypothetical protein
MYRPVPPALDLMVFPARAVPLKEAMPRPLPRRDRSTCACLELGARSTVADARKTGCYWRICNLFYRTARPILWPPRWRTSRSQKRDTKKGPLRQEAGMAPPLPNSAHGDQLISAKPRGTVRVLSDQPTTQPVEPR